MLKNQNRDGISKLLIGIYVVAFLLGLIEVIVLSWQSVVHGYLSQVLRSLSLTGYGEVAAQVASVLVCIGIYTAFIALLTRPLQRFGFCEPRT